MYIPLSCIHKKTKNFFRGITIFMVYHFKNHRRIDKADKQRAVLIAAFHQDQRDTRDLRQQPSVSKDAGSGRERGVLSHGFSSVF